MPDMNDLSMTDLAAYGEDESRCGECKRPIDWCECPILIIVDECHNYVLPGDRE